MKKTRILLLIFVCLLGCFFVSCDKIRNDMGITDSKPDTLSVTFIADSKRFYGAITESGGVVAKPSKEPTKTNYKFVGWSLDEESYVPYDFRTPVSESFSLYAHFTFDTEALKESIEKARNSIIKIENKCYNSDSDFTLYEGIGFIFYKNDSHCYAVTNCQSMMANSKYKNQAVTVKDVDGKSYVGYSYRYSETSPIAAIPEYDLAVVAFEYTGSKLKPLPREDKAPAISETVVALGKESGDEAYGEVIDIKPYEAPLNEALSNVDFDVIYHNANLEGQAQGVLFNLNMTVAGFTYVSENGISYTVPSVKISEFLNKYVYNG